MAELQVRGIAIRATRGRFLGVQEPSLPCPVRISICFIVSCSNFFRVDLRDGQ